ncbi:hypothetical protein [Armatimonas sp.]|uniref:hypothetical protein n=1 Tax=Armatimonas sp. TaxID=1872638 RepID=UPI003752CC7D
MRLHDGELHGLQAFTVRRHVKHCTSCKQNHAALGCTDALLQTADFFMPEPKHKTSPLRPIGFVGGVTIAIGAALFFAIPGGPFRPMPSFAAVEDAMEKIKTVHWTETMEVHMVWAFKPNGTGRSIASDNQSVMIYESWGDMVNHQLSHVLVSGKLDGAQERRVVMNSEQAWDYMKTRDRSVYLKMPSQFFQGNKATKIVMDQVVLPKDDPGRTEKFDSGDDYIQTKTYLPWKQSDEEREGKKLLRFDRTVMIQKGTNSSRREVTVWVDRETMRVARREEIERRPNSQQIAFRCIAENFRYNETPPSGVFELPKPKVGEHYQILEAWSSTREIRADEQARKKVVEEAIRAYSRKDMAGFLALWDFDAVPQKKRAARQQEARAMITTQTSYKSWRAEKVMSAHPGPSVYVRKSEADPFPPPPRAPEATVDVNVRGWVTTAKVSTSYPALATFTLTKRSGQWKIQQLQLSTKPLPSGWLKGKH